MDLVKDIINSKIRCSCTQCKNKETCLSKTNGICSKASIKNKQALLDEALTTMKENIVQSKDTKMNYISQGSKYTYNDNVTPLHRYYVSFINDVLNNIRLGKKDYVFNLEQVKDIIRYEPDIEVTYQDDFCYEVKKY